MTATAIISLVIGLLTLGVWAVRFASVLRARRTERAEQSQASAEQADDIRSRTQRADISNETTIPRLTDDELDADLARLRAAAKAGRKAGKGGV